ncbi:MAG: GspH/FimT family pseudopilin [bacterium]
MISRCKYSSTAPGGSATAGLPAEAPASAGAKAGYSLAEILVVLAIIGLIIAVVPLGISRMLPGMALDTAAQTLAEELRTARARAVDTGTDSGYRVAQDGLTPVGDAGAVDLQGAGKIEYHAPDLSGHITRQDRFRFLPDGSSTGGYFLLKAEDRERRVAVHWLFGHVEVLRGEGAP